MIVLLTVGSFVAAYLLSSALTWLALIPFRRSAGAYWTERARLLYPVRVSAVLNPWLFAANVAMAIQMAFGDATQQWLPPAIAAWIGAAVSGFQTDRIVWPGVTFRDWFAQFLLYAMFFQASLLLVSIALLTMPERFGRQVWAIAVGLVVVVLALSLGLAIQILRATRLVKPAPTRLKEIAARAAKQTGVELRHVWINDGPAAHAFAFIPMKGMLFSQRALDVLTDEELFCVCAHEAAHLGESKWILAARLAGGLALCPIVFVLPVSHAFGSVGLLALVAGTMFLFLLPTRLAHRMEKRADTAAAAIDPLCYARSLEKLYEANLMPATMPKRNRAPHRDLYDRMSAAGLVPEFERPKQPRKISWTSTALVFLFVVQLFSVSFLDARKHNQSAPPDVEQK